MVKGRNLSTSATTVLATSVPHIYLRAMQSFELTQINLSEAEKFLYPIRLSAQLVVLGGR